MKFGWLLNAAQCWHGMPRRYAASSPLPPRSVWHPKWAVGGPTVWLCPALLHMPSTCHRKATCEVWVASECGTVLTWHGLCLHWRPGPQVGWWCQITPCNHYLHCQYTLPVAHQPHIDIPGSGLGRPGAHLLSQNCECSLGRWGRQPLTALGALGATQLYVAVRCSPVLAAGSRRLAPHQLPRPPLAAGPPT